MTRRTGASRTTQGGPAKAPAKVGRQYPSLRERQPVAFWLAIIGTFALVLSTIASFLRAIL
jgi:hypothetical protein